MFDTESVAFFLPGNTTLFEARHDFALTQLDVTLQCEENVASLQVSVNDMVFMEVDEGL